VADSTTLHSPPIAAFKQLADANRVTAIGKKNRTHPVGQELPVAASKSGRSTFKLSRE